MALQQSEFLGHFLRHQDDIRAVIGSMVRDRSACEDIFQEVALVLWRKFGEFDETRSFGAWARGIAVRKVLQSFDRNKRIPVALSPETIEVLLGAFDATEPEPRQEEAALRECLGGLPEKSKHLIELRYETGLRLDAVAERVASTMGAVHKAISRIRIELRKCIERRLAEAG